MWPIFIYIKYDDMVYHNDIILETLMEELSKIMLMEKSRKQKQKYDRNRNDRRREEQQRREQERQQRQTQNTGQAGSQSQGAEGEQQTQQGQQQNQQQRQPRVKLFRPTQNKVISTFNELNQKFFMRMGYSLYQKECSFEMTSLSPDNQNFGYFHYDGRDKKNGNLINPKISINQDYQYSEDLFRSVVAHEMIHYVQASYYNKKGEKVGHDENFMFLAEKINSALGLNVSPTIDLEKFQQENPEVGKPGNADFDNGDMPGNDDQQGQGNQQVNPQVFELMSNMVKTFSGRVNNLKKKTKTDDVDLRVLYSNYLYFTNAMIVAMQKCIQARTLNEAQGGWGLETPGFVQDYINGFKSGFNSTTNATNDFIRRWQYQKYGTRFDKNGNIVLGNNTKLNELLTQYYPPLKEQYVFLTPDYSNLSSDEDLQGIVRETDNLCTMANIKVPQPGQNNQQQDQQSQQQDQEQQQDQQTQGQGGQEEQNGQQEQNNQQQQDQQSQSGSGETQQQQSQQTQGQQQGYNQQQTISPEEQARRKQAYQQRVNNNRKKPKQANLGQRMKKRRNEDFLREIEDYLFALLD